MSFFPPQFCYCLFPLTCIFCFSNVTWVNIFVWNSIVCSWIYEHNLQTDTCKISLRISHGLNTKQTGINLFVIWGSKVISLFANILPNYAVLIGWKCCATFSTNKTKKKNQNQLKLPRAHFSRPLRPVYFVYDWFFWLSSGVVIGQSDYLRHSIGKSISCRYL